MIAWFARNGVAVNLLAAFILLAGFLGLRQIKVELFPSFSLGNIQVSVAWRGAAPEEVEEQILEKIEAQLKSLEGIDTIESTANEGSGRLNITVLSGFPLRKLLDDIQANVDTINTFPADAERPVVRESLVRRDVLAIAIYGPFEEKILRDIAREVRDELIELPGISQVELSGARSPEISIEVDELALRRYQIRMETIAQAIRAASLDLPGGTLKTDGGEILVRSKAQAYHQEDFENIVVLTRPDGTRVLLKHIATVKDGFEDVDLRSRFNNQNFVGVSVLEVGEENPLEISRRTNAYLEKKRAELPEGISIESWSDVSFYLQGRLNLLIKNGTIGLLFVFSILALFLRPSLAFWVAFGIPISFFGAFMVMPQLGMSINLISLFGFIMVLGIVVDDAIVVGERVFTEFQNKGVSTASAIAGTQAVAMPVTFAVLTTIIAFLPMTTIPGFEGKFVEPMAWVVIITLLFSLLESKCILPYHLSLCKRVADEARSPFGRFQQGVTRLLQRFIENYYRPFLGVALRYRYLSFAIALALLCLTQALMMGGWIKSVPFPAVPSDYIQVFIRYPEGTPASTTEKALKAVNAALDLSIERSLKAGRPNPIEHRLSVLGQQDRSGGPSGLRPSGLKSHLAQITVELRKSENRHPRDSAVILARRWRESIEPLPGISSLRFRAEAAGGAGEPVDIQVTGDTLEEIYLVAESLKQELRSYNGLYAIRDSLAARQQEIQLQIKPSAELLGLTQAELARQVRAAFSGIEVQRIRRDNEEIRVYIRYPEEDRRTLSSLENFRVRLPSGQAIPFSAAAEVKKGLGYTSIKRLDSKRIAHVYANADKDNADLEAIKYQLINTLLPSYAERYPALKFKLAGEAEDVQKSNQKLTATFSLALLAIYALLAIAFRGYLQPFIIMSIIPFGLIGAVWGHLLLGHPISRLSIFGILALTGVLINDSLVLVDYINRRRKEGMPLVEAISQAGVQRFRPILLTSLTTFVGLVPLLFERSLQAQFLIPMAISLSFGILFATFITLLLIPSAYLILEDIRTLPARLKKCLP